MESVEVRLVTMNEFGLAKSLQFDLPETTIACMFASWQDQEVGGSVFVNGLVHSEFRFKNADMFFSLLQHANPNKFVWLLLNSVVQLTNGEWQCSDGCEKRFLAGKPAAHGGLFNALGKSTQGVLVNVPQVCSGAT